VRKRVTIFLGMQYTPIFKNSLISLGLSQIVFPTVSPLPP
jgi:hypothetical protein